MSFCIVAESNSYQPFTSRKLRFECGLSTDSPYEFEQGIKVSKTHFVYIQ